MNMSYRQIVVDGSPVGLRGLDELFADLQAQGRTPQDDSLGIEIVKRMSQDNYIPYGARELFAAAFVREYAAYLARCECGDGRPRDYGTWRGYPREQIPWYPTANEDLCNGCRACLKLCKAGVFALTDKGKVAVVDPFACGHNCFVGCSSCANLCRLGAITFPDPSILDAYPYRPTGR